MELKEIEGKVRNRYEEMKQKAEAVEKRLEKKIEEVVKRIATIMQNACTSLLDPKGSQD